eukprot:4441983-Pleurochrysis_carterae.AAC.1
MEQEQQRQQRERAAERHADRARLQDLRAGGGDERSTATRSPSQNKMRRRSAAREYSWKLGEQ